MQKSVIQRENGNFKRKTCYPTRQIVIQGENVLSNVKTCYTTWKMLSNAKNMLSYARNVNLSNVHKYVIQHEKLLSSEILCYPMRKRVIQRKKGLPMRKYLSNAITCYPTLKRVMQRENVISNAKTYFCP